MFVDQADIKVVAGDGGRGCMSFRREKFVPRGGPDGGDGGTGGSVWLHGSAHHNTLANFKFHPLHQATRGAHGEGSSRSGRAGKDLVIETPVGTVVYEKTADGLTKLADLTAVGQAVLVAAGGRGGRGNECFATSTNRSPRRVESGKPGQTRELRLCLKLLADVGLVGFPNVGKSTLIARLSAARPKIANYPFTTLTPNLGVVQLDNERSFVIADVPGLIAGAHAGQGLGHRFLSHVERTKVLVHVIDVSSSSGRDPVEDFETICQELVAFTGEPENDRVGVAGRTEARVSLATKPQIAAANKIDALDDPARLSRLRAWLKARSVPLYPISAVTGEGVDALCNAMWHAVPGLDSDVDLTPVRPQPARVSNEDE